MQQQDSQNPRGPRSFRRRGRPQNRRPQSSRAAATAPLTRDRNFGDLLVSAPIADAIASMGYETPSPIQEKVIPAMLDGQDIVGQAQTGTGKTAAFGIPLAESIDTRDMSTQAIVLTPTRELAAQVAAELQRIGENRAITGALLFGGERIDRQIETLRRGAHIAVGTPGRVLDHLRRGTLVLDNVKIAVLDEADEMLDIGFIDDIETVLRYIPGPHQTTLFSATMPSTIRRMVQRHLKNPSWVRIGGESQTLSEVDQTFYEVDSYDRNAGLVEILEQRDGQTIVFCRTQRRVDRLTDFLGRRGHRVLAIHGGLNQAQRTRALRAFRAGDYDLLIATNVAARGLDIPSVSCVINYDTPQNVEEYVHRIGRTARMGREGAAITFVSELDFEAFGPIQRHVGNDLKRGRLAMYTMEA